MSVEEFSRIAYGEWWKMVDVEDARVAHTNNVRNVQQALREYYEKDRPIRVLALHGSSRSNTELSCAHEASNSQMLLRAGLTAIEHDPDVEVDEVNLREYKVEYCNNSCWVEERILTSKGWIHLKDIMDSDSEVLDGSNRWHKPSKYFSHMRKEVYRISTRQGYTVHLTDEHEVYLYSGEKKRVRELVVGDKLKLMIPESCKFNDDHSLPIFDLSMYTNYKHAKVSIPTIWSQKLGELLGYMAGDGWISESEKRKTISFSCAPEDWGELYYLADFVKDIAGSDGHSLLFEDFREFVGYSYEENPKTTRYFKLGSIPVADWLRSLGFLKTNSHNVSVPELLWQAPKEAIKGFLRGVFTADGSVPLDKRDPDIAWVFLASVCNNFLFEVQRLLLQFGIRSSICGKPTKQYPCYQLQIYALEDVKRFRDEIGFILSRKQNRLNKIRDPKLNRRRDWARVDSIESIGIQSIADIEMPVDHSFTAGGIRISNCYSTCSALCGFPCDCFPFDPMQALYPKVLRCDVMFISTGVNQSGESGRVKVFEDRLISVDGGYFRRPDQFASKGSEFRDRMIATSKDDEIQYDQRMHGRVAGFCISSKDDADDEPTDDEYYNNLPHYIESVAGDLYRGFWDYGWFFSDPWLAGFAAHPNEDTSYDKQRLNEDLASHNQAMKVVRAAVDLARRFKDEPPAPRPHPVGRT